MKELMADDFPLQLGSTHGHGSCQISESECNEFTNLAGTWRYRSVFKNYFFNINMTK